MRKSSSFQRRETWISKLETSKLLISDIPQVSFEKAWSPAVDGENKSSFSTSFNRWWYISHLLLTTWLKSIHLLLTINSRQHCTVTSVSGSLTRWIFRVEKKKLEKKNCATKTLEGKSPPKKTSHFFFKDDFCLVSFSGSYLSTYLSIDPSISLNVNNPKNPTSTSPDKNNPLERPWSETSCCR